MKWHLAVAALGVSILGGCWEQSPPPTEIVMAPVEVGTKTPDYEVISPTQLKLAAGVKLEVLKDADGQNKGFVLRKASGALGGFMACGCPPGFSGSCPTANDNPDHPSCGVGGCWSDQGNYHDCEINGPFIGPPMNPFTLKFLAKRPRDASPIPR